VNLFAPNGQTSTTAALVAPTGLHVTNRTANSIQFAWNSYSNAVGWVISYSKDNASTWRDIVITNADAYSGLNLNDLSAATALWVKVAALAPTRSPYGDVIFASTKGAKPVTVKVVDFDGSPVQGGQITWAMIDRSARSSKTYGLTDLGEITFPSAPAGLVQVTVTNGLTADGALVTGSWRTTLGFERPTLRLPDAPTSKHVVRVVLENGLPVQGAQVAIPKPTPIYGTGCIQEDTISTWIEDDFDEDDNLIPGHFEYETLCVKEGQEIIDYEGGAQIDSTEVVNGFTFTSQVGPYEGATDLDGTFEIHGFFAEAISATVIYDDTVITQEQTVLLTTSETRVQLEYMPYVQLETPTVTTDANKMVPIEVSINDSEPGVAFFANSAGLRAAAAQQGIRVTLIPAKGSTNSRCKAKLSGTTDASGRVQFKVCPNNSGFYRVKAAGAASVAAVRVQVKGAAPMPVRSIAAKSPAVGKALVSWEAPLFDGKSTIKSYKVVATAKGKKTITKVVSGSSRSATLTGLTNGVTYQITVSAVNAKGTSPAVTTKVPVA